MLSGVHEVTSNRLWVGKIRFELVIDDFLQIDDGDLGSAGLANVFRAIRRHIHLPATVADREAGEQLARLLAGFILLLRLFFQDLVHVVPKLL